MARKKSTLGQAISSSLAPKKDKGSFNLKDFKKSKYLSESIKFKPDRWIPISEAFADIVTLPGLPMGHITLLRGHSDTGKTTAMIEAMVSCQKAGILPVIIVTEMKWSWDHVKKMGFEIEEIVDEETGEVVNYDGFFIYADRGNLTTIEDVAAFIADLLNEQMNGGLPYDLCFFWDSIGSIPCKMSVEKNTVSNEWNAGAMSQQFGNFINQKIILSRKENYPYTNSMIAVNKVWVDRPKLPMEQPKLKNKAGDTMFFDSSLVVTFGNVTNSGTSKIKATKNGKEFEFAKRTKVSIDKNHINGIQTKGVIIMTVHGFIKNTPTEINNYKKAHSHEWVDILGNLDDGEFDIVEDDRDFNDDIILSETDE